MSFRVSPSERRRTLHFHLAAAFAALCSLAPPLAHVSNIPYPPNCTIPSHVVLTGLDAHGAADPLGTMTFEIRSLVNLPLNNAVLAIDFGQTPDVRPSEVQPDRSGVHGYQWPRHDPARGSGVPLCREWSSCADAPNLL